MVHRLIRKVLVIGIIVFLVGIGIIPSNGSYTEVEKSSKTITEASIDAFLPPLIWTDDFFVLFIKIPDEPVGDLVFYSIEWGDGSAEWFGPYSSSEIVPLHHLWEEGKHTIKTKVKNQFSKESKWATYEFMLSFDFKFFHISIGYIGINYIFTTHCKDCVYYLFDWGDGSSSGWLGPFWDEIVITNHTWNSLGEYTLKLKSKDINGNESNWLTYNIKILSPYKNPPGAPNITGLSSGKPGVAIEYKFNAVDPDGDQVKYIIEWGDDKNDTTDLNLSGVDVTLYHTWSKKGNYIIKAYAQDEFGLDGPESSKSVTIPRSREVTMHSLVMNLLKRFPLLERILNLQ